MSKRGWNIEGMAQSVIEAIAEALYLAKKHGEDLGPVDEYIYETLDSYIEEHVSVAVFNRNGNVDKVTGMVEEMLERMDLTTLVDGEIAKLSEPVHIVLYQQGAGTVWNCSDGRKGTDPYLCDIVAKKLQAEYAKKSQESTVEFLDKCYENYQR